MSKKFQMLLEHHNSLAYLTHITNPAGQSRSMTYDNRNNLTSVTDAKGQNFSFTYDSIDRLISKTMPEGNVSYVYDNASNLTKVTHPNGSQVTFSYDAADRMIGTVQTLPNGFSASLNYTYDANGNRTSMST